MLDTKLKEQNSIWHERKKIVSTAEVERNFESLIHRGVYFSLTRDMLKVSHFYTIFFDKAMRRNQSSLVLKAWLK